MQIRAAEISDIIREQIKDYEKQLEVRETGVVLSCGDGIARIYGLDKVAAGELIEFPHDIYGMVLNLEEDNVGAAIFGEAQAIKEGDEVRRTGRIAEVPVGDALLGRVVNALGQPIDGKGPIKTRAHAPHRAEGARHHRAPARQGAAADRHQGDRRHDPDRPRPARADHRRPPDRQDRGRHRHDHQPARRRRAVHLRRHRPEAVDGRAGRRQAHHVTARWSTRRSSSPTASDPAPLQFIAPYTGCTMGEYFRDNGRHALVIYDDLSKQAVAYRQLSLLLRRPPGPRGVPRRRLLSPLAPARARRQDERRAAAAAR